jgi:hypothetical protein
MFTAYITSWIEGSLHFMSVIWYYIILTSQLGKLLTQGCLKWDLLYLLIFSPTPFYFLTDIKE